MALPSISAERLRELFSYDPDTGVFIRLVGRGNNAKVGRVAGAYDTKGYLRIMVDGRMYKAHRLAWFYSYNVWPNDQIDHINGDPGDNRLINLREATNAENSQNIRRARADNKSGFLGVSWHSQCELWVAQIEVNRKHYHLGLFETPELAHAAYVNAKRQLHPGGML